MLLIYTLFGIPKSNKLPKQESHSLWQPRFFFLEYRMEYLFGSFHQRQEISKHKR